ncbi:hypothetical protein YK48G_26770 [Lentilactobacillus fungorum]|uniref:Uncharacterized protein n=1 Tax=Lentilactobacillus fungorum TaxID=2201250 RepID=A0ABQ3W4L4_9LACO|nr:hypothetical protein YK48G_26770 [Lentilactobacillus fungorum]
MKFPINYIAKMAEKIEVIDENLNNNIFYFGTAYKMCINIWVACVSTANSSFGSEEIEGNAKMCILVS